MQTTFRTLADAAAWREVSDRAKAYISFARYKACSGGDARAALAMLERDPQLRAHAAVLHKGAVEAMTVTDATSAGPLASLRPYAAAFLALVRPRTLLGRLAGAVNAPMNVRMTAQSGTQGVADYIGEAEPTPLALLSLDNVMLPPTKLGIISFFTKELARSSDPSASEVIQADLVNRLACGTDIATLDPTREAIPNTRPASLTYGATQVSTTGNLETSLALLIAAISGGAPAAPYLAMSPRVALYLSIQRDSGGRIFPDVGALGGSVLGVPVLVVTAGAGDLIVALDATGIAVADGGVELDSSEQASVEASSTPTNSPGGGAGSPTTPVETTMVSLWQTNSIGIKATRFLNFARRDDAVAYLEITDGSPLLPS